VYGGMRVVVDSGFKGEIMEREGLMVGVFCVRDRLLLLDDDD